MWTKMSDTFWSDPRLLELGNDGFAVAARALSYCGQHLTDGRVPKGIATMLDPGGQTVAGLVRLELWRETEGGFEVVGYLDDQLSREQVLAERERARARRANVGRRGGVASGERRANVARTYEALSSPILSSPSESPSRSPVEISKEPRTADWLRLVTERAHKQFSPVEDRDVDRGRAIVIQELRKRYPTTAEWEMLGDYVAAGGMSFIDPPIPISILLKCFSDKMLEARDWHNHNRPHLNGHARKR
jgi:hypothetical protein